MSPPTRILLLEMPTLLRGLMERAIGLSEGCELMKDSRSWSELLADVHVPDVVILGLSASDDCALVPAVFSRWPQAQVMTVGISEGVTVMYELQRRRSTINDASPEKLMAKLNEVVQRSRAFAADQAT